MVDDRRWSAEVAEQADASVSKTDVRKDVRVRLPLSAPRRNQTAAAAYAVTVNRDFPEVYTFIAPGKTK